MPAAAAPASADLLASRAAQERRRGAGTDAVAAPRRPSPPPAGQSQAPDLPADPAGSPVGHVMSVASAEVWGMFEAGSATGMEIGDVVRLVGSHGRSFGIVASLRRDGRRSEDSLRLVEIRLVGEILAGQTRFQRGISSHPPLDSPIYLASRAELVAMYGRMDAPTIRLGTLRQAGDLPAYALTDNLLGKHFAVLGTTGAGKSCAVTVILKSILRANPFGHVIMFDPHNEYGRAFGEQAEVLDANTMKLPYWLLNNEELAEVLVSKDTPERAYAETAILREAVLGARRAGLAPDANQDHLTVDTPTPYRLSELVRLIKEAMGAFNKTENSAPYQHLISRIESIAKDRRYEFMFSSFMVKDTLGRVLAQLFRMPVAGKPITIIDMAGMPSEIVDVVVSVLCRVMFDFALWSERGQIPPMLLVCEEAHRYVPGDDRTGFAPTKRAIARIAKEGRKYGLGLCLVSQRPAELSISSLSQCNTIFALRMGNEHDLKFVQHTVPDSSRWLVEALPTLNTREAIVIGDSVTVPMHIRFDTLAPDECPASLTPPFSSAWQSEHLDPDAIDATIERWRKQIKLRPGSA